MIKLRFLYIVLLTSALTINLVFTVFFLKSTIEENYYLEKKTVSKTLIKASFNEITQGNFREFISSTERSLESTGLVEISVFDSSKQKVIASNKSNPVKKCVNKEGSFCLKVNAFTQIYFEYRKPSFLSLFSTPLILKVFIQYSLIIILIVLVSSWILKVFANRLVDFFGRVLLDEEAPEIEDDYKSLKAPVLEIKNKVKNLERENTQYIEKVAKTELARKLAHDIKSPLATLKALLSPDAEIDKEVLTSITERIKNISDDLLDNSRQEQAESLDVSESLENLKKQKEIEHHRKIELVVEQTFSLVCLKSNFNRTLSNIINNAVEFSEGTIYIRVSKNQIVIEDEGVGIPKNILKTLLNKPVSFNKSNGNGIGLSTAKQFTQSVGGSLQIESTENVGTKVIFTFNKVSEIVHIDDDSLVRFTWKQHCREMSIPYFGFSSYKDFQKGDREYSKEANFYVDFDLTEDELNGVEVIKELSRLGFKKLYLSTGYSEDEFEDLEFVLAVLGKGFPFS